MFSIFRFRIITAVLSVEIDGGKFRKSYGLGWLGFYCLVDLWVFGRGRDIDGRCDDMGLFGTFFV